MGEMEEGSGYAACLSPLGELAPGAWSGRRRVQSKALGFIDRERGRIRLGKDPAHHSSGSQAAHREVALPTTSWGLHAQSSGLRRTEQPGQPGDRPGLSHLLKVLEHSL